MASKKDLPVCHMCGKTCKITDGSPAVGHRWRCHTCWQLDTNGIMQGDVMARIAEIPDDTVDCIVTSPPYYELRNYNIKGQWGREATVQEYMGRLMSLMQECNRVLKPTGSLWCNIGDTYHGKGMLGVPERYMVDMLNDGWILRSKLIWHKRAAMPESVKDRLSRRYEPVYFFVKNLKYYFNLDAIRVPSQDSKPFNVRVRDVDKKSSQSKLGYFASDEERKKYDKSGIPKNLKDKGQPPQGMHVERYRKMTRVPGQSPTSLASGRSGVHDADGNPLNHPNGRNPGDVMQECEPYSGHADIPPERNDNKAQDQWRTRFLAARHAGGPHDGPLNHPAGKNPGDILSLSPEPLPYDHFAAFPTALPKFCISCSCPPGGLVLDPFVGSGSTLVAAKALGMQYIGIELNPEYIEIARDRLAKTQSPLEVYARE